MKVRSLLVGVLFMAMVAVFPLNASAAPAHPVTEYTAQLSGSRQHPFAVGLADYRVYADGSRSLAYTLVGANGLSSQRVFASVFDGSTRTYFNVCAFRVDEKGNGGCVVNTHLGDSVPTIIPGQFAAGITTSRFYPHLGVTVISGTFFPLIR